MHRTIEITVAPSHTAGLVEKLRELEHVIGLSVQHGISIKPPGDVLTVHVLNKGAGEVLRHLESAHEEGTLSVVTSEVNSFIDPEHQSAIEDDVDEAMWEEIETGLRHQGRVTVNYLLLMALGGAIAATGFVQEHVPQGIAFVAASIIAPGFEPIAKIPLGLVLRRWHVARRGLISTAIGYGVLIVAAAAMFALMRLTGEAKVEEFMRNSETHRLAHPNSLDILVSTCAALAGTVMMVAYRRHVIAGPLIALAVVPAAAMTGVGLMSGQWQLAYEGIERFAVDALLIIVVGAVMFGIKQATGQRRFPLM